jgi:hypothetical protein
MYLMILFIIGCAVFFYRAGAEHGQGFIWSLASIAMACVTLLVLHFAMIGFFVGQALILAVMVALNIRRSDRKQA